VRSALDCGALQIHMLSHFNLAVFSFSFREKNKAGIFVPACLKPQFRLRC